LFGSYARNEQTEKSDIDIMVDVSDKSFRNYLKIIDLLELQFPDVEVQVVSKGAIKPDYFEYVKPDLLYA
jgi:predicted nucleotidyltransferase